MLSLVLSLDYEIFGNGSGDVRRDMIEPTGRLVALCDRYGAKVTIMCEVGEYWAMQETEAEACGSLRLGYSPSTEIAKQLQAVVRGGHDVQLHLHPWWIGARFGNGGWQLRPELLRVTDLPENAQGDSPCATDILRRGKETLETIVRPVCPEYACLVYRAAMFWGQPSQELILSLRQAGLAADSSVVPGLYETAPVPTDYRCADAAAGHWWTGADDISRAGPEGEHIIEFPVRARLRPYACNFKWTKLAATLKRRQIEKANTGGHGMMNARKSRDSWWTVLRKLSTLQPLKYDFCKLSADDMIAELRRAMRADRGVSDEFGTPVVMLGHSKDFWNDANLETFLRFVREECRESICFSTLGELTARILARSGPSRGNRVEFDRC